MYLSIFFCHKLQQSLNTQHLMKKGYVTYQIYSYIFRNYIITTLISDIN